jgi:DNA-binding CsgD family transcriptional regulator
VVEFVLDRTRQDGAGDRRSTLLGRATECGLIDGLLTAAVAGTSGVLVIRGEIGVGKSALLQDAATRATELGMSVLRCRGLESESQLPYAGLADLLRPIGTLIQQLPSTLAAELAGALAIGPPAGGNRFAVYLATLDMLSRASDDAPVLVNVDDLQWVDRSSAEAVLFAARRLQAEGVVVLFASRDEHGTAESGPALDLTGLDVLSVTGLPGPDGEELVRVSAESAVSPRVARQLAVATGGNPLALVELTRRLSPEQLSGRQPLDDLTAGGAIDNALSRILAGLPAATRTALLVIAASDVSTAEPLLDAMAELGLDPGTLDVAESVGLLKTDVATIGFRHPLMRSLVYRQSSGASRRTAHAALAAVAGRRDEPEREAWHRAAALVKPDAEAAEALARTATHARARAGPDAAARALERAAQITNRPDRRVELLVGAAREALTAGGYDWSLDLVHQAADQVTAPDVRAELVVLRAAVEQACGSAEVAHALLGELGARVGAVDRSRGAVLLAGAALAAIQAGQILRAAASAEQASSFTLDPGSSAALLTAATSAVVTCYAAGPSAGMGDVLTALDDKHRQRLPRWPSVLPFAIELASVRGHDDVARRVLDQLVAECRAGNELGRLPIYLTQLAELHIRDGRWYEAYAEAVDAVTLAKETGQHSSVTHGLGVLARLEACRGDEDLCRQHLTEADDYASRTEDGLVRFPRDAARGLWHLTMGRAEQAIEPLTRLVHAEDRLGLREPAVFGWLPDLVEAYVKTGQTDAAAALLPRFDTAAEPTSWTLAVAARCRGLLATDESFENEFSAALEHHGSSLPFERARTELCFGERLRRNRRRAAALPWLDSAADTFARMGARPWAQRARAELAIAGGKRRPAGPVPAQHLTPQELQIALQVGRGLSNREVAANLFLSDKTVEAHLTRIYRALGVRSRGQLAAALRSGAVNL